MSVVESEKPLASTHLEDAHLGVERFFIGGREIDVSGRTSRLDLVSPVTERQLGHVILGNETDVDMAVLEARKAFKVYSEYSLEKRIELLEGLKALFEERHEELSQLVTHEIGAPISFSRAIHAGSTMPMIDHTIAGMREIAWEEKTASGSNVVREPIGVCGLITPWNFPLHQIIAKVAAALAAGCTMVLKPSELSPFTADAFAEIFHMAGYPDGTLNVVHGDGLTVGEAISSHPGIDMISFTGSTRAGRLVARAAADTVKRVHQELGGKSAAIMLEDGSVDEAVAGCLFGALSNTGQACMAWGRFLVPRDRQAEVIAKAQAAIESMPMGDPGSDEAQLGAISNKAQYDKVQRLIEQGIDEGATLVTGGLGRPDGKDAGFFVRPTLFADVDSTMTIAREEIFGPVVSIMPYDNEDEAVEIANSTVYGLSGAVFSADHERARSVAHRLRTGMVHLNGANFDFDAPFGGYGQSGNGREWGKAGIEDFLETKAIMGYYA
ncbi:MAG: aldehyde dehydrogenase family protein [Pseudomonadota bacterium]